MEFTSVPESNGCWSSASGNFDGQLLSIGVAQWNFGQGSLQPLLKKFKSAYVHESQFKQELSTFMPLYGPDLFSSQCLSKKIGQKCINFINSMQNQKGKLNLDFQAEVNKLFDSDLMTQIQADIYIKLLGSVSSDLKRIFTDKPTTLQVKWAIDTKVQQGEFPKDSDLKRVREKLLVANDENFQKHLIGIITWYKGLCMTLDQDGTKYDYLYNVEKWTDVIKKKKYTQEAPELLMFTFLRSRVAAGKGGLYQADTFQRRAKIIFGVGSVHGSRS